MLAVQLVPADSNWLQCETAESRRLAPAISGLLLYVQYVHCRSGGACHEQPIHRMFTMILCGGRSMLPQRFQKLYGLHDVSHNADGGQAYVCTAHLCWQWHGYSGSGAKPEAHHGISESSTQGLGLAGQATCSLHNKQVTSCMTSDRQHMDCWLLLAARLAQASLVLIFWALSRMTA
jgi:hypothetical protein